MRIYLALISVIVLFLSTQKVVGQSILPQTDGDKSKYTAYIELKKGYVSGICMLVNEEGQIKGSIFNEFGISFLDFTYNKEKDDVKVHNVIGAMNKWYIKRVLKNDIKQLMKAMEQGESQYIDQRHKIKYILTPFSEKESETTD